MCEILKPAIDRNTHYLNLNDLKNSTVINKLKIGKTSIGKHP